MLGGILLYLGDMLYYFTPSNPVPGGTFAATSLATLAQVESWRIVISGVLGVVCAWLYALGAWQGKNSAGRTETWPEARDGRHVA